MKIVLDTNVFLVSLAPQSKYHSIFQALKNQVFDLYLSNEILTEYEEIISLRLGQSSTNLKLKELLNLKNIHCIEPFYKWQLIENEPDDNKFFDCAVVASVDFLVTNDSHFNVLKNIPFPSVNIIRAEQFLEIIDSLV